MCFSQEELTNLRDITESIRSTDFGRNWPQEYVDLYKLWGYFNRIYNTLDGDQFEWKRIARFAIDNRFQGLNQNFHQKAEVRNLAQLPCVGNGRNNYQPEKHIQIAFHTLRQAFDISIDQVCYSELCTARRAQGWRTCVDCDGQWTDPPQNTNDLQYAKFTVVVAALTIVYQIRNNLFHGSKMQMSERDVRLVRLGTGIVITTLEEICRVIE